MNFRRHVYLTLESRQTSPLKQCLYNVSEKMKLQTKMAYIGMKQPILMMSAGQKWMMGGLALSSMVSMVGGAIQGWPMLAMMRESDQMMIMCLMGVGLVLLVMVGIVSVAAMRSSSRNKAPPEGAEALMWAEILEAQGHKRSRRHRH